MEKTLTTANTYIVSSAGKYKFKATVKGNGGLDPLTGATAFGPVVGGIDYWNRLSKVSVFTKYCDFGCKSKNKTLFLCKNNNIL